MKNFEVRNIVNLNGNEVRNQFVIKTPKATYFQSYSTIVAKVTNKGLTLSQYWDYSNTTLRHLYNFLRSYGYGSICSTKEMRKAIKNKEVTLSKLNSLNM